MNAYQPPGWLPLNAPEGKGLGGLIGLIVSAAWVISVLLISAAWWLLCGLAAYVFVSPDHARAWLAWWWAHRSEPAPGGGWLGWWWAHRQEAPPGGVPSNVVRLPLPRRERDEEGEGQ